MSFLPMSSDRIIV